MVLFFSLLWAVWLFGFAPEEWSTAEKVVLKIEESASPYLSTVLGAVSPNGRRIVYWRCKGSAKAQSQCTTFADGKEVASGWPQVIVFSQDSKRLAFLRSAQGKEFWVVDGKPQAQYPSIDGTSPGFSADGTVFSYVVKDQDGMFLVSNGIEGKKYETIFYNSYSRAIDLHRSPKGTHLWFSARLTEKSDSVLVIDGNEHVVPRGETDVSPDARRIAITRDAEQVTVDGIEHKRYKRIGPSAFSPDGNHYAYPARDTDECFLVLDGEELRRQPCADTMNVSTWNLTFSPDGKKLAYTLQTKDGKSLVVDGVAQTPYRGIVDGSLTFSPDSKRVTYIASDGKEQFVVVDGIEQEKFSFIASLPVFSPDSQTIAYAVSSRTNAGKWQVVLDGQPRGAYEMIKDHITDTSPSNTPRTTTTQGGFFIDATDRRMNRPYFTGPSSCGYLAKKGDTWYWVEETKRKTLLPNVPERSATKKK